MSNIFYFIFLSQILLGFTLIRGQNVPPQIVRWRTKREQYVPPGNGTLYCAANGTGTLDFSWFMNGERITTSAEKYGAKQYKELSTSIEELNIKLDGDKLKPEDEGFYQCTVRNSYGTTLSDVTWLRRYQLVTGKAPKPLSVNEGDVLKLPCEEKLASSPSASVKWLKALSTESGDDTTTYVVLDERVQIDENGTLVFSYVLESDQTKPDELYSCVLENSLDKITRVAASKYSVSVAKKTGSDPTSLKTMFTYVKPRIALLGSNVTLGCFFGGSPQITIKFTDSNGYTLAGISSKSSRIIRNLEKTHSGKYICTGNAKELMQTEELQVIVQERPTFLESPRDQTAVHGGTAEFKCSATADPEAKIEWFKNGILLTADKLPNKMYMSPDKKLLKIENLCKEKCQGDSDLMVLQCNASNIHGYAFGNGYLNVLYKTEITTPPVDVEYDSEKPVTFHCEAKTDPDTKLTYKWLFNDKPLSHGSINSTSKTLYLNIPEMSDKGQNMIGKWTCVVSNSYTNDSKSAYLKPQYVPAYVWPYWWVVLLTLLLFLLLLLIICIVCCCLYQNRGDQYPVDEIEQKNGNNPEKELEEAGFHDYQRDPLLPRTDSASGTLSSQERTISRQKRSQGSLSGTLGRGSKENLYN